MIPVQTSRPILSVSAASSPARSTDPSDTELDEKERDKSLKKERSPVAAIGARLEKIATGHGRSPRKSFPGGRKQVNMKQLLHVPSISRPSSARRLASASSPREPVHPILPSIR